MSQDTRQTREITQAEFGRIVGDWLGRYHTTRAELEAKGALEICKRK